MENGWDNTERVKRLIFIVVPQLRIADDIEFVKNDSKIILKIVIIIMII